MDEGIFLKQHVIMPARVYFPFLRLARLIFRLYVLNDKSPKKSSKFSFQAVVSEFVCNQSGIIRQPTFWQEQWGIKMI